MSQFDKAIKYVLRDEGGLVEDPNDPGGLTNFGISYRWLKSIWESKPEDEVRHFIQTMREEDASKLYLEYFWKPVYEKNKLPTSS